MRITPGYFETVGMVLRLGRGLLDVDRGRGVVINKSLARRYWPGRNPVGETIHSSKRPRSSQIRKSYAISVHPTAGAHARR